MEFEKYKKSSVFLKLKSFCHFAKDDDFMEITEWKNGEGFDIYISSANKDKFFSLTYGELEALLVLSKIIDK